MPYIKVTDKSVDMVDALASVNPENAGELNFVITHVIRTYFEENGGRYQQINDIIGALEGAKLEFYRRIVAPYEDAKIKENGDVY